LALNPDPCKGSGTQVRFLAEGGPPRHRIPYTRPPEWSLPKGASEGVKDAALRGANHKHT